MSREIKYRAFHKGLNKVATVVGCITKQHEKDDDNFGEFYHKLIMEHGAFWDLERVTLLQYTGLKDVNGTPIYEGDILKVCSIIKYTDSEEKVYDNASVIWDKEHLRWGLLWDKNPILIPLFAFDDRCEQIGNIYENLELLEET
jgi:uncharacterized phage protein (TIGR01671 family)